MNEQTQLTQTAKKERNLYISYIKGAAIIGIILIHLIDWSNMRLPKTGHFVEDLLHSAVLLFVLVGGSVTFVAYERKPISIQVKRLIYRAGQLLFIYYLYSIVKLLIFNFRTEPFYEQFSKIGTLTIPDILKFHSFSVPITVLITYPFLLAISPLFLLIAKKARRPVWIIGVSAIGLFIINYWTGIPNATSFIIKFIYANGYVLFPIALWLLPFLIGFFLAQVGFEKQRRWILIAGMAFTVFYGAKLLLAHQSLSLSDHEFPLSPYFIAFGVFMLGLLLYFFRFVEKTRNRWVRGALAASRLLGDKTLSIYIYHWVVIDLTIWIFYPHAGLIWLTVAAYLSLYLLINKKKLFEYYLHQKETARELGAEIS
ncbi:MAG: acyltransferase family protein [Patescibacteria group bacterium]|nr:acyltransferase family protein [Patescibacteria group bacterium]